MTCLSTSPNNYGASDWVAGQLPIRFTLSSTRWPVNSEDNIDFFFDVQQDGAYAQLQLAGSYESYVNREFIQVTNATNSAYNGIWQIIAVDSPSNPSVITISAPYVGAANGNVQRYYNNYNILVRVYSGIPDGHYLAANRPMTLRTTLRIRPDADNEAEVDVGSVIRNDLTPITSKLCDILETGETIGNDWYNWTGFYIEFAESYDISDGVNLSTFTSEYTTDTTTYYASNSTKQFQDFTGWSMGEYVLADYNGLLPSKYLTLFPTPVYFEGNEYDLSILSSYDSSDLSAGALFARVIEYTSDGSQVNTFDVVFPDHDAGFYRIALSEMTFNPTTNYITIQCIRDNSGTDIPLSEAQRVDINRDTCGVTPTYLRWQNYLGGWDSWLFPGYQDFGVQTSNTTSIRRDVSESWDTNFVNGDTEDDYVSSEYYQTVQVRSQFLTAEQVDVIHKWLRLSIKVYEVYLADRAGCGDYDQRTVLVQKSNFTVRRQADKYQEIGFQFRRTDRTRVPFN